MDLNRISFSPKGTKGDSGDGEEKHVS
jgi:hypothetical protein